VVAGLGELAAVQEPSGALAEFGHPVAGRLLPGGGLGHPLLSELALVGGVGEQSAAVRWGVAEQSGDPVAFGAQLALAHLPQGQGAAVSTASCLAPSRRPTAIRSSWMLWS
jgi:hypothetical protein